ncbi:hypothetical protein [Phocaeicola sp.]
MKKNTPLYLLGIILCCMGCSQEINVEKTQLQQDIKKLETIASEYGFSSMPITLNENFVSPLTEEYCNQFENKLIKIHKILSNTTETKPVQQSRALSDRHYNGMITIDKGKFPISIYWDETFDTQHSYAIAQGTIDLTRNPEPMYNYLKCITLTHVSTKESESRIPKLYFVMRCNYTGFYKGTGLTTAFSKRVEFIVSLNVNTLDLETTITVFEDGMWEPKDFEI